MPARFRILFIIVLMALLAACGQMPPVDDKVTVGLAELIKQPQVQAFAMWSQSSPEVDPFNFWRGSNQQVSALQIGRTTNLGTNEFPRLNHSFLLQFVVKICKGQNG